MLMISSALFAIAAAAKQLLHEMKRRSQQQQQYRPGLGMVVYRAQLLQTHLRIHEEKRSAGPS